jgi:hypothetical protein
VDNYYAIKALFACEKSFFFSMVLVGDVAVVVGLSSDFFDFFDVLMFFKWFKAPKCPIIDLKLLDDRYPLKFIYFFEKNIILSLDGRGRIRV